MHQLFLHLYSLVLVSYSYPGSAHLRRLEGSKPFLGKENLNRVSITFGFVIPKFLVSSSA